MKLNFPPSKVYNINVWSNVVQSKLLYGWCERANSFTRICKKWMVSLSRPFRASNFMRRRSPAFERVVHLQGWIKVNLFTHLSKHKPNNKVKGFFF